MTRRHSTPAMVGREIECRAVEALTTAAERVMSSRPRRPWGPRVPWWCALALAGFAAGVARRRP